MDTGKIKNLSSALHEALLSARPSPAQSNAGATESHESGHPGRNNVLATLAAAAEGREPAVTQRNGVIVNLSGANAGAVREAQRPTAEGRNSEPPVIAERAGAPTRSTELLARALQAAHTGPTATVAQALARAEELGPLDAERLMRNVADAASPGTAGSARPAAAGAAVPQAMPAAPPDAATRLDPHAAPAAMIMTGSMASHVASTEPARAAPAAAAQRPHAELITPLLVRQERSEAPAPYLNQLIIAAVFLGLVILLVL